jgi:hypothetical protein
MDSTTFVPMYDLEHLNEDQKATYYRDACNFLGIPANLNLLAYIEMVVGDNGRHLVLYAKKGATDLIRQNRGISTISLEALPKDLVPGQVCFMAAGRDKNGREERAIGAADIDGLRGKALTDAVMIAQTRATRRMTLQFVGGGILDESEIPASNALVNNVALDTITAQPVVVPNPAPSIVEPPEYVQYVPKDPWPDKPAVAFLDTVAQKITETTPAQKEAQAALVAVKPETLAVEAGEKTVKTVAELIATLPADNPLVQAAATVEAPKQRKRKQAGLTLNTPQQEAAPILQPAIVKAADDLGKAMAASMHATIAQAITETPAPTQANSAAPTQALPAQPVEPPKVEKLLSPDEEKAIKERLAKYRNEILPTGGMVPVDKIGGVEIQLRKFVGKFNAEKPSSKTWNYTDWLKFVDFLDDVTKVRGAAGLVKYMQEVIGIAQ